MLEKCKQSILREFIIIICNSNLYTIMYTAYICTVFFFTADLEQDRLAPKCLLYDGYSYLLLKCPSVIIIITIIGKNIVGKCKLIFYTGPLKQKIKIAILKIIKQH